MLYNEVLLFGHTRAALVRPRAPTANPEVLGIPTSHPQGHLPGVGDMRVWRCIGHSHFRIDPRDESIYFRNSYSIKRIQGPWTPCAGGRRERRRRKTNTKSEEERCAM